MTPENKPLTAIRGVAALWVVGLHLNMQWHFPVGIRGQDMMMMGHVAVDVFFVLSGFILTLVYRDLVGPGFGPFMLRRICRVYPLHLCIMAVLGLAGLITMLSRNESHAWSTYWPAVLLIHPYLNIATDWNVPSWSIGVELLCYLLFPMINLAMQKVRQYWLLVLAAGLALLEAIVLSHFDDVIAGPGAVFRAMAGFLLGSALARLFLCHEGMFARHAPLLQLASLAVFCLAVLHGDTAGTVLGAALLIAALAPAAGPVANFMSLRGWVWLGDVSFSIYLLHIPLLSVFEKLPAMRALTAVPPLRFAVAGIFLVLLLILSGLSNWLIEQPFRRLPRLIASRSNTGVASAGLLRSLFLPAHRHAPANPGRVIDA